MTPNQTAALMAHAAKIQAAHAALNTALMAAIGDPAMHPDAVAEAAFMQFKVTELAEDSPWFYGLVTAEDVAASF